MSSKLMNQLVKVLSNYSNVQCICPTVCTFNNNICKKVSQFERSLKKPLCCIYVFILLMSWSRHVWDRCLRETLSNNGRKNCISRGEEAFNMKCRTNTRNAAHAFLWGARTLKISSFIFLEKIIFGTYKDRCHFTQNGTSQWRDVMVLRASCISWCPSGSPERMAGRTCSPFGIFSTIFLCY